MKTWLQNIPNLSFNAIVIFVIIVIPKINLISISENSQGIRIEDIILLFYLAFYLIYIKFNKAWSKYLAYIIIVSIAGLLINPNEYTILRILSLVRIFEYLILFYVVSRLKQKEIYTLVFLIYLLQFSIIVFQYIAEPGIRSKGTTAGPWEVALSLCSGYIFLIDYRNAKSFRVQKKFLYISLLLVLYMTAARMQLVAMAIILIAYIASTFPNIYLRFFGFGFGFFTLFFISNYININYVNFSNVYNGLAEYFQYFSESIFEPSAFVPMDIRDLDISQYDPSLISRLNQWVQYLTTIGKSNSLFGALFFGSGLNSGGITLDGFYVKLFVDLGLIGLLVYLFILWKMYRQPFYKNISILLAISSLTLDIMWASKFIYFLILIVTYDLIDSNKKNGEQ
jgi:hypothetical protein